MYIKLKIKILIKPDIISLIQEKPEEMWELESHAEDDNATAKVDFHFHIFTLLYIAL